MGLEVGGANGGQSLNGGRGHKGQKHGGGLWVTTQHWGGRS